MRGRTNISNTSSVSDSGTSSINGDIVSYEITGDEEISSGDFVELFSEGEEKIFGSDFTMPFQKQISENRYILSLYTNNKILYLVDTSDGFNVLDTYTLSTRGTFDVINNKTIIANEGKEKLLLLKIEENKFNVLKEIDTQVTVGSYNSCGVTVIKNDNKIIFISLGSSLLGYSIFSYDESFEFSLIKSDSYALNKFNYTISELKEIDTDENDNVVAIITTKYGTSSTYYNGALYFIFDKSENALDYSGSLPSGNNGIFSGFLCYIKDNFFFSQNYNDDITTYKIDTTISNLSSINIGNVYYGGISIGRISDNRLIISRYYINSNKYVYSYSLYYFDRITVSMNLIHELFCTKSSSLFGKGIFICNKNKIYYIWNYNNNNSCFIDCLELINDQLYFCDHQKVKKFENSIFGIAKNSGTPGETIDIYVPHKTE